MKRRLHINWTLDRYEWSISVHRTHNRRWDNTTKELGPIVSRYSSSKKGDQNIDCISTKGTRNHLSEKAARKRPTFPRSPVRGECRRLRFPKAWHEYSINPIKPWAGMSHPHPLKRPTSSLVNPKPGTSSLGYVPYVLYFKLLPFIIITYLCIYSSLDLNWNPRCMILGTYVLNTRPKFE